MNITTPAPLNSSSELNHSEFDHFDLPMEWEGVTEHKILISASIVVLFASIILGAVCNIAAIVILIRRRLWLQHEGYLYVLAIFVGNVVIVVFVFLPHWLWLFPPYFQVETTSDFSCKMWRFLVNVFYSTGWYVCAMLLNVYLRSHLTYGIGCVCWQKFASKFCTRLGSLVVNGVLSGCFFLINCWMLRGAEIVEYGIEYHCTTWYYTDFTKWEVVSVCIQWYSPFCILIPVLWALTLWFFFDQDDQNRDTREFFRLSLIIAAAVFVTQFPMIVVEAYSHNEYHSQIYLIYRASMLLFATHVVVVPLCSLFAISQMREELRSVFKSSCCPLNVCSRNDDIVNDINRILPLETIQ